MLFYKTSKKLILSIFISFQALLSVLIHFMGCFLPKDLTSEFYDTNSLKSAIIPNNLPSFLFKTMPKIPQNSRIYHETIKILTYNILADAYIGPNFSYCDQNYLDFSYRGPQILKIIDNLSPDILCLQEVDHYKDFYLPGLSRKYEVFEEKRGGFQAKDGLITAFCKKTYIFLRKTVISYDNEVSQELFDSIELQNRFRKGNKALILELKSRETHEKYIIVNTHLHWDPKDEDVKLFQMVQLLKHLENRYKKHEKLIICGDFNSLPDSDQIQLILKEKPVELQIKGFWKKKIRNLKYKSAYSKYRQKNTRNYHPSFTNYTRNFKGNLDYIFYAKKSPLQLKRLLKLPKSGEISENIALPNKYWPSDHLPLMAEFKVEKNP